MGLGRVPQETPGVASGWLGLSVLRQKARRTPLGASERVLVVKVVRGGGAVLFLVVVAVVQKRADDVTATT